MRVFHFPRDLVLLTVLLSTSGCTFGPEYVTPTMTLPDRFAGSAGTGSHRAATDMWWTNLQDPVLNTVVTRALRDNLSLQQADARVVAARAQARAIDPELSIDGKIASQVEDGRSATRTTESLGAVFGFSGARAREREAAQSRVDATLAERDAARLVLLSNVVLSFIDLRYVQSSLILRSRDLARQRQSLQDIEAMRAADAALTLDVLEAKGLIAESEVAVANLAGDLARHGNRLATLLGTPSTSVAELDLGRSGVQPLPAAAVPKTIPADLIRNRPDIRQAEKLFHLAVAEVGVANAERYPSLTLSGTITAATDNGSSTSGILGVGINIPIFDQGARKATVDARVAEADVALLEWRSRVLVAVEEVETALATVQASAKAVSKARQLVALRREALAQSRELLKVQEITVLGFIDQERSLSEAQEVLVRSRRAYGANYALLEIALGATPAPEELSAALSQ